MEGLRRLPHGIAQELLEQKRLAVRSLGVVGPVPRLLDHPSFLGSIDAAAQRPCACSMILRDFLLNPNYRSAPAADPALQVGRMMAFLNERTCSVGFMDYF